MLQRQQIALKHKIYAAFKGVILEDGIGLWEGQGLDDYATPQECYQLRTKDEKHDWSKITLEDMYRCSSSLSFFDAKGIRFHLPQFLLFALDVFEIEEDKLYDDGKLEACSCPEVEFHLTSFMNYLEDKSEHGKQMLEYHTKRFSLLNMAQINCVIAFLEFRIEELKSYNEIYKNDKNSPHSVPKNKAYITEIKEAISQYQIKISVIETQTNCN